MFLPITEQRTSNFNYPKYLFWGHNCRELIKNHFKKCTLHYNTITSHLNPWKSYDITYSVQQIEILETYTSTGYMHFVYPIIGITCIDDNIYNTIMYNQYVLGRYIINAI